MYTLNKINVWSSAKVSAIIAFVISLVMLIPMFLISLAISAVDSSIEDPNFTRMFMGGFMISIPFFYAITAGVMSSIMTAIYNLIADKMGGIQFDISKIVDIEENNS